MGAIRTAPCQARPEAPLHSDDTFCAVCPHDQQVRRVRIYHGESIHVGLRVFIDGDPVTVRAELVRSEQVHN